MREKSPINVLMPQLSFYFSGGEGQDTQLIKARFGFFTSQQTDGVGRFIPSENNVPCPHLS
jgi:hypothetical protein